MVTNCMSKYTAFLLDETQRTQLLGFFRPQYTRVLAHHITHQSDTAEFGNLPASAKIEIIGIADDHNGVQALVVNVDGKYERPDGLPYHITWSIDPRKTVSEDWHSALGEDGWHYKPHHANLLVMDVLGNPDTPYSYLELPESMLIKAIPVHIDNDGTPPTITPRNAQSHAATPAIKSNAPRP